MSRTQRQEGQGKEAVANADIDLKKSELPRRPEEDATMARLVNRYERYVRAHPERATELLERCRELTVRCGPGNPEKTPPTVDAVQETASALSLTVSELLDRPLVRRREAAMFLGVQGDSVSRRARRNQMGTNTGPREHHLFSLREEESGPDLGTQAGQGSRSVG